MAACARLPDSSVIPALALLLVAASPAPAAADLTAFIGFSPSPASHGATGLAIGGGFLIVAFEFEYSHLGDDVEDRAPSLTTASGNVLVQTPVPISGWQFYGTLGGGGYRERLEDLPGNARLDQPRRRRQIHGRRAVPPALRLPHLLAAGIAAPVEGAPVLRRRQPRVLTSLEQREKREKAARGLPHAAPFG